MGQFLEDIGLGHHVAAFIEQDVSGDMLLELEEDMLEELEVTSPIERLKIKVKIMVMKEPLRLLPYLMRWYR